MCLREMEGGVVKGVVRGGVKGCITNENTPSCDVTG